MASFKLVLTPNPGLEGLDKRGNFSQKKVQAGRPDLHFFFISQKKSTDRHGFWCGNRIQERAHQTEGNQPVQSIDDHVGDRVPLEQAIGNQYKCGWQAHAVGAVVKAMDKLAHAGLGVAGIAVHAPGKNNGDHRGKAHGHGHVAFFHGLFSHAE